MRRKSRDGSRKRLAFLGWVAACSAPGLAQCPPPVCPGWSSAGLMQIPLLSAASAELDGVVYLCGGVAGPAGSPSESVVEAFDLATGAWNPAPPPLPNATRDAAAVALNGKLYVLGGEDGGVFRNSVVSFDPAANAWSAQPPMLQGRSLFAAVAYGGRIYVFGGFDGSPLAACERYDPAAGAWTPIPSMPFPRHFHDAVVANGAAWIAGGQISPAVLVPDLWRFDFGSQVWVQSLAPIPTSRIGLHLFHAAGSIYAIGGSDGSLNPQPLEVYDPVADAWSTCASLPAIPHFRGGAAQRGTSFLLFGGDMGSPSLFVDEGTCLGPSLDVAASGTGATGGTFEILGEDCVSPSTSFLFFHSDPLLPFPFLSPGLAVPGICGRVFLPSPTFLAAVANPLLLAGGFPADPALLGQSVFVQSLVVRGGPPSAPVLADMAEVTL
ncbi:MAG: Kelch repeat-containing protein [Planctomycetota bacterium]